MKKLMTLLPLSMTIIAGSAFAAPGSTKVNVTSCGTYEITCDKDISNIVYRSGGEDFKLDNLSGKRYLLEAESVTNIWVKCGNNASAKRGYGEEHKFLLDNDGCSEGQNPSASLGDLFWNDLNKNGYFDNGEPGLEGVEMCLKDEDGQEIATTSTNSAGFYQFAGLQADTVYTVCVKTLPADYELCPTNAGQNDNLDSDFNPGTLMTDSVTLSNGESNTSLDGCAYKLGI